MSLENPNFEGQTTEGKIRDRCNIRRCTQIRAKEQTHVFVLHALSIMSNLESQFKTHI